MTVNSDDKIVGIIYPPPEVRNIVDKTAAFVARNGPEFEQKIKQNEINNPKFNFLNAGDPYNAYYQYKVNDIKEIDSGNKTSSDLTPAPKAPAPPSEEVAKRQQDILTAASKTKEAEYVPDKIPPDFQFMADPPSISALDLDVVKLTAQFVARNGRQFLTSLMNREQRNFQFDFLRPQHSLFQYFTKLLEQYTKILIPPKDMIQRIREDSKDDKKVRDEVRDRVAWIRHVEAKKKREEEEAERERVSYAQVDWHNFVVVETVDYQAWESGNFPPPTSSEEVGARVLMQRRVDSGQLPKGANTQVQDMDQESSEEESEDDQLEDEEGEKELRNESVIKSNEIESKIIQPPPALPTPGNVEVRKYDPKQGLSIKKKAEIDEYLVSPITGERIHASKVQEHMRIGLLDPRWIEERDKQLSAKASDEQVFASGSSIENSLKSLAERRTDIFGVGQDAAQETAIGKKIGEEEKKADDKGTWDGHTSTAEAAARAARVNITINEQIEQIHRNKGLISDNKPISKPPIGPSATKILPPVPTFTVSAQPMPPTPVQPPIMIAPVPPVMVPPQPFFMAPQPAPTSVFNPHTMPEMEEEPPTKKAREDSFLPEDDWLNRFRGPISFRVVVPSMPDKPEWQLKGQTLKITQPLNETVSSLKAIISEMIGMPPGKQKLQTGNTFFKDSNILAYYNVSPQSLINLLIKERGGRKK